MWAAYEVEDECYRGISHLRGVLGPQVHGPGAEQRVQHLPVGKAQHCRAVGEGAGEQRHGGHDDVAAVVVQLGGQAVASGECAARKGTRWRWRRRTKDDSRRVAARNAVA